jgi:c-di-GMP phosphodiesterase
MKSKEDILFVDHLTGLNSRTMLLSDLKKTGIANLILIDIDKFSHINNIYGMSAGDAVLMHTAKNLRKLAKARGYKIYRIPSNEYALLDDTAQMDLDDIYNDIHTIIDQCSNTEVYIESLNSFIRIHVTVGFATSDSMLLEQAGTALEYAKKNYLKFAAYSNITNDTQTLSNYIYWDQEIQKALENKNILPVFQPIVDHNGKIIKHEVLMRLRQEKGGEKTYISPIEFLDVSVETKWYSQLSETIIFESLRLLEDNQYRFSINFAYQDIKNKVLMKKLYGYLETHANVAKRCTFEILENELVEDTRVLFAFITKVRQFGVQIAVDDFGSGFSNFEMILLTQPDIIKIDGTLIKNVDIDSKALTLVEAIVAFSHKMGIKVIAEFVHSKEVYEALKDVEIDMFQGYYFSQPLFTFE